MARGLEERTRRDPGRQPARSLSARGRPGTPGLRERLTLTERRVEEMAAGLRHVASLPDPVGETVETIRRPSGLEIAPGCGFPSA